MTSGRGDGEELESVSDKINSKNTTQQQVLYNSRSLHVTESPDKIVFTLDIPGVKHDDVKVTVQGTTLKLLAERKQGDRVTGRFSKAFELNEEQAAIKEDEIQASLVDGVLNVVVPKKQEENKKDPKTINYDIQVENTDPPHHVKDEDDKEDGVRFTYDVPGIKAADLKVSVVSNRLVLCGERKHRIGRSTQFHRSLVLDPKMVQVTGITAYLADGVLTVMIPKKQPDPVRNIAVSTVESIVETASEQPKKQSDDEREDEDTVVVETVNGGA